jgi:ribonucleotide monophosphatase NagD (HAD superfamily)
MTEGLRESGFEPGDEEVLTPAALALTYCQERGLRRVELLVSEALRPDLEGLQEAAAGEEADAVLLGDLGERLDAELQNRAFRRLMAGAELLALGHNRYWRREDGLALEVGAFSAALEYGAQVEATVPSAIEPTAVIDSIADLPALLDRARPASRGACRCATRSSTGCRVGRPL